MKGYHYLMRLGHLLNAIALYSERLAKIVKPAIYIHASAMTHSSQP
jgi:hypothetical protein